MLDYCLIVDDPKRFANAPDGVRVVSSRDYIALKAGASRRTRFINLCTNYDYLSNGYYCSLLSEARGDRMMPSAEAMLAVGWKRLYRRALGDLTAYLQRALARNPDMATAGNILVCFGQVREKPFARLGRATFDAFRCPVLSIIFSPEGGGRLIDVDVPRLSRLGEGDRAFFDQALARHIQTSPRETKTAVPARYTLAVLHDPKEEMAPSNPKALQRLIRAGASLGVKVDLITKRDLPRLAEYDALFIRETTALDHHTYRFAKRAERDGIPCIDDATSILRCTNKVYLAELFRTHGVPAPRTILVDRNNLATVGDALGYPIVLKIPDGSFSRGVKKASTPEEAIEFGTQMLRKSGIVLAQEYLETPFDWRVGILAGAPLFASKYYMARGHWQVVDHKADGARIEGGFETVPLDTVPAEVMDAAFKAARLIGDGLYGVDIKQSADRTVVIEVNDNPNLDAGIEDKVMKEELWRIIIRDFIRRIEAR